tara:strand:- start:2617 stop:3207 length:591 start_codon:yes stop_codon:yes gene_type:complete
MVATMGSGMSGGLGAGGAAGGMSMGTAFAGAGIALQGFSMMYQKKAAKAAAAAQQQAMEYNAKIAERNAKAADIRADFSKLVSEIDIGDFREDFERLNASVGARYRAAGFRSNTGTPRDIQIANAREADEEIQVRRMNADAQVISIREQGVNSRLQANLFRNQGQLAVQTGAIRAQTATIQGLQGMAKSGFMLANA